MQQFKRLNDLVGWGVFLLAAVVYGLTVERTASYWDVGEFIAASYKLEVPHPPGAPFFLLIGRMFSLFAPNPESVAVFVNFVSVISSAFTIMFLYWSIVLLARKMVNAPLGAESSRKSVLLIGSGLIGALAYTFSDSFWFSAVEAEVYAMSSFFMAIVVWAMLKWELLDDPRLSNRWLILIAYIMGLSIGVHLLNLVAVPALALIYYHKRYTKYTTTGVLLAMFIGLVIVGVVMVGIIPGLPSMAGSFEIFFVNNLGLPFGSGAIFFVLLFLGALIFGVVWSERKNMVGLNTALLGLVFILIGYSSYTLVVIRSNFNPPIDENNPENLISFVSYLKREQYGDRPLLFGQYFDAELERYDRGDPVYRKGEDKYEIASYKPVPVYGQNTRMTILPRAYSTAPQHQQLYRQRMGLQPHETPGFGDNLAYMFDYQMGHMYWRYFLWNFVGRQGDYKDAGVLTPFNSSTENMPDVLANNEARNNFWMLPLILGVLGAFYQFSRDKRGFGFVLLLFFLSGLALILYLNSPPIEPRERDYIYVGSFYAFAMWIGFGVIALAEVFEKGFKRNPIAAPALATALCLLVPGVMAAEGWDDHDRSNRYFSVDSAKNFLSSLAPNAILFTGGDNDTFPLWYAQEVEGFRTDVRVIVLTYFNTDWYIDQMKMQMNESEPLPISLTKENYKQGGLNDVVYFYENKNLKGALPLEQYIKLVREGHPAIRLSTPSDDVNTIPSRTLSLNIDRQQLLDKGIIPESMEELLVDKMEFKMTGNALEKKDLMLLDLLVTNNWERPVYFNNTSLQSISFDLSEYVVHEGTTYRLLPVRNPNPQTELVNTEEMYENMMNDFFWRELDNEDVYYTEDYRNFVLNHRASFNTLAGALLDEGKTEKALNALHKSLEVMPDKAIPYDYATALTVQLLLEAGDVERAVEIGDIMAQRADEFLTYLEQENKDIGNQRQINLVILNQLSRAMANAGREAEAQRYQQLLGKHYQSLQRAR
jgi:tetratricopeptide (TPR) repeat protein